MKIRSALALAGLAVGFVFPTFAGQKDAIDPKIDQQIRALASKFDEAYNKNDPGGVAALYTEDAVRFNADNSKFWEALKKQSTLSGWAAIWTMLSVLGQAVVAWMKPRSQ